MAGSNNPYNHPNAVSTAGSQTYSKAAYKAGTVNPYDAFGAATRDQASADQKSQQASEQAAADQQRQADLASQVAQKQAEQAQKQADANKPPKQSFGNKIVDIVSPNTPSDIYRRQQANQPAQFGDQQKQQKDTSQRAKDFNYNPDELNARRDFYQQNGINVDDALKQKKVYDDFNTKYKGQSLAHLTLTNNPDLKAAQQWEKTKQNIDNVEQKFQSSHSTFDNAARGVITGAATVGGNLVTGGVEAINKHVVEPFISAPAGAAGSALADATSGKGFDFRKQYQLQRNEPDLVMQATKAVDKKWGTNFTSGAQYGKDHPVEVITTTGLVLADIATDGALTPLIAPALTGYYGTKYVAGIPTALKAIGQEKDTTKKYALATEFITQGLLLAKGASDTVSGVRSLPTEKTVAGGETQVPITHQDVVEFSRTSNPNLSPETISALQQVYNEGGSAVKDAIKSGSISVKNPDVTVPTVYGKILTVIKDKLGRGEQLTPAEEAVVQQANGDPMQFVKTKDVIKYNPDQQPATSAPTAPTTPSAVTPAPDLAPVELPTGIAHPDNVVTPPPTSAPETPKGALKPLKPEVVPTKSTGTITTYSGHQGRGSAFSTPDKQFATQFANEDANGNQVKGTIETKKLNKADILDTRNAADRTKLESILGSENVTKMIDSSGNGLPAHVDKGEQDALVKAAGQLGYKHIALSETDTQTKYNGSHVVSYVDTSPEVTREVTQPKGTVKPLGKKPTATITYPEPKNLPANLKERVPVDTNKKGFPIKEKLTPTETERVTGQTIGWDKSKLKDLVKTVPGLKENPVLTVHHTSDGVQLQAKVGTHEFSIPAKSLGLNEERLAQANFKEGDTVDIGAVLEAGTSKVPVINKGKTSFSGTSGGNTAPKATPKPEPKPEPTETPVPKAKPSNPVKRFMDETAKNKEIAGKLDDQLHALGGNTVADNIALNHLFKEVKKLKVSPEDWTAVYHYAEDRSAAVTPEQKALFDTTVKPLQDSINKMREDMGLKPFANNEFIHRIAQGRGSSLERYIQGDNKDISPGNVLKKTSDSMKTRTYMKLVDDAGNTRIVSIKTPKDKTGKALGERQVTAFDKGKATPMGALKRKIPDPVHEFYDPAVMDQLNKIAEGLGLSHERTNIPLKRGDSAAGVSYGGTNVIKTKTASPMDALLHEIGHQIDDRYGLQDQFLGNIKDQPSEAAKSEQRIITQELRDLADQRLPDGTPKSFNKYVRSGEEKMAVMFQAYLHAPEIFQAVAPVTFDKFEAFLKSHPETKPIANIKKSLILGSDTIGDVRLQGEFIDKTGKKWQIKNATTKEIETNTNTRYFKQPLVSTAIDYMQTRQALRASQFLDKWKTDPSFLYKDNGDGTTSGIAVKSDAKSIPDGWKTTTAMQFRGYHFEPRTAEVLDDFAKTAARGDPLGAFTGMNLFLRNTIFYNPLLHVPNIFWHAVMRRGISGIANPIRLIRGATSSVQAINQVIHHGDLYQTMLREGAPLMSFDRTGLTKMIGKMMEDTIQDDAAVSKIAKLAGYANKANFVKAWYKVSAGVTWNSHDFFMMQAMIEEMNRGLTPQEAIHEVTAHIPDYRLPTRFFGSRSLKTTLSNHNVTMFLPYHYGIFKSYANTVREMAGKAPAGGKQESGWKGRAKSSARGMDKLLMAGVIMFLIYPQLDNLAKKIFGDSNATARRAGPFTFPYAVYRMLAGKKSIQSTAASILPTPPGTKGVIQLIRNRDDLNRQIWNPSDAFNAPVTAAKDLGKFVFGTIAPAATAQKAAGGKVKSVVESFFGVSSPNDTKTLASKLLGQQLNLGVQSKAQQRLLDQKNAARDQIAAGKGDQLAKDLVANGVIKDNKLKEFEATAKWTPLQRTFDALNMVNKLQVLQKTSPQDWAQLGDLKAIKDAANKTATGNKGTAADKLAAGDIVKMLNGDTSGFKFTNGQKTTHQSILQSVGAYASAFATSPLTAFNRIFTGQRILRTANGAIIVERMPQTTSAGIRNKLGAGKKGTPMQLDHIIPLELGGSNDISNLQLIPKTQDEANNPIENYLGKQLQANKINAKQAKQLILDYKNGKITAADVYKH